MSRYRQRRTRLALGAAAAALLSLSPVAAQGAAADEAGEEVIVTAQKRAQSTLDVGVNVTAMGTAALRERRIEQVPEFVAQLPNVDIKENSPGILPVITIRGVGLNDFSATNNPSAGVYIDEVYLSSLALMNFDLFDIERMEALKGPQGTLYGRNSTAGAINILTARPDFDGVHGRVGAGYGDYETTDIEGFVNVPVSETFALRFSAKAIWQDEGFWFNEANDRDLGRREMLLGRVQARWQPSEDVDVILKIEGQRGRSETGAGAFFGLLPPAVPVPGLACPGSPECTNFFGYSDTDGDPFRGAWSVDPTYDVDQVGTTLRVEADLGFATLTSVTGYIDFERQAGFDTDAGPLRLTDFVEHDDISQFSQETRLSGENGGVTWLAGLFYSHDTVEGTYEGSHQELFNTTTLSFWDQTSESAAIFGNLEYAMSETVSLIGGLRYTWEEKSDTGGTLDLLTGCPFSFLTLQPCGGAPIPLATIDDEIDDTNWSWKVGLNWKPNDETLVYASITQGVKSGGFFSGVATSPAQLLPYGPETLVSYEAGVKQRLRDIGLSWSASIFYYDYSDVQTFIRDDSGGLPIQRLGNVDEAEVYGLDFEVQYSPVGLEGLTLSAGLGLLETELGAFASSTGPVPKGNELPDAPDVTATLGASYEFAIGGDWTARLAADARYTGSMEKDALNDPIVATDSYWVWNARAGVFDGDGWEVSLWGKNLSDEEYVTQGISLLSLGYGYRVYGPPRTFGISIAKAF
jgi:iron complex outermembrane receptor protein